MPLSRARRVGGHAIPRIRSSPAPPRPALTIAIREGNRTGISAGRWSPARGPPPFPGSPGSAYAEPSPWGKEPNISDLTALSDEELVRRIRGGDASGTTVLFDRHLSAMRAMAHVRLPAALRAKVGESDVVQSAYIAAFSSLAEFEDRGDGSFRAWLRQILEHKVADEVRRHAGTAKRDAGREVTLRTGGWGAVAAAGARSATSMVAAAEDAARIRGVVDGLPADYATVIRLVHLEGRTLVEAGENMGRSADAVRMLYNRAMDRLADRLGLADGNPR